MKKRKPTAEELLAAKGKTVPDVLSSGLSILFCGINPSLYTAVVGHHFARPGNRFWPALHHAGLTDRVLKPEEEALLLEYGCGITNIVPYATASENDLSKKEFINGGMLLREKLRVVRPASLAVLGIGAYRKAFSRTAATPGLQDEPLEDVPVWVLPNPSGLNAHYQVADIASLIRQVVDSVRSDGPAGGGFSPPR